MSDKPKERERQEKSGARTDQTEPMARGSSEVQELERAIDKTQISLADAIKRAEQHSNGKAVAAIACTGDMHARHSAQQPGSTTGQPGSQMRSDTDPPGKSGAGMTASADDELKYEITCLVDGRVMSVTIDGQNGTVLAMNEESRPHSSAAFSSPLAQGTSSPPPRTGHQMGADRERRTMNQPGRIEKASDLLDKELRSTSGEKVGDIEDLIVNPDTGKITFVVASFDKAGSDDKWRAIPCGAVDLPDHARFFTTNVDRDRLRGAPSFTSNQWPALTDVNWNRNVYTYYGETPYWERERRHMTESERENRPRQSTGGVPTSLRAQKITDLMKKNVKNPQNENLGDTKDFAIDPDAGRVAYGVVAFGGFLGIGEKWFAVPMRSLNLSGNAEHFIMNTDKEQLKKAEGFDKDKWPNMADSTWATRTHSHYNQRPYWEEE